MTGKISPKVLLFAVLCCGLVELAAAQVFKWVDENGVTHYGERPPQGRKAQPMETNPSGAPVPGARAQGSEQWKEKDLEFRKRRIQREREAERDERAAKDRQRRCHVARDDLRQAETARRQYRLNDRGERVYLDEAERKAALDRARRRVEESCS